MPTNTSEQNGTGPLGGPVIIAGYLSVLSFLLAIKHAAAVSWQILSFGSCGAAHRRIKHATTQLLRSKNSSLHFSWALDSLDMNPVDKAAACVWEARRQNVAKNSSSELLTWRLEWSASELSRHHSKARSTPATMSKQHCRMLYNVECCFDNVAVFGNNVEATFDFVAKNGNNVERVLHWNCVLSTKSNIAPTLLPKSAKLSKQQATKLPVASTVRQRCFDIVASVDRALVSGEKA